MAALVTAPAESTRTVVRWAVRHGLVGVYLDRSARQGDPLGRLLRTPGLREDPWDLYEQVRARGPLSSTALGLVTASHGLAQEVLRSEQLGVGFDRSRAPGWVQWALRFGNQVRHAELVEPPSMLVVNPPEHTRYRRLVSRGFTPRATAGYESVVRQRADELLDDLERRLRTEGTVDLVEVYAAQLPVLVIAELLAVPTVRREDFLRWGALAAATLDPGLPFRRYLEAERALKELQAFLAEHFARLRREPGDDLVSRLVTLDGDEALTERELMATVMLLLGAGFETTVNLLGNAVVLLDAHRDQWEALAADPSGWDGAVEEVLRYDSPVQITGRTVRTATTLAGRALAPADRVTLLLGAANRDPEVFADPARFDVTRPNAREHLAFSGGIHYCLGAGLARLEGVVGLRALTERFPGLRVAGRPVRRDLQTLRGFEHVPVALGA